MVSIQDLTGRNLGSNPQGPSRRMSISTFDILPNRWIVVEKTDELNKYGYHFHHIEIGPFNLPEPLHLAAVKEAIWNISSLSISSNWGSAVEELNTRFYTIKCGTCTIHNISENQLVHIKSPNHNERLSNNGKKKMAPLIITNSSL